MTNFLLITGIVMLALGLVSYASSKRAAHTSNDASAVQLPGDIKYESPNGRFRFYFPVTTSIVISMILTLALGKSLNRQ
jgi:hypothetical protein